MTTFTLASPVNVGGFSAPLLVAALTVTSVAFSTTPDLAPLGTGELDITLTDPVSGWQETVSYRDETVLTFLAQAAAAPPAGATIQSALAAAVFAKLIEDGQLPTGTVTVS
jgi:hypothetical protein